MSEQPGPSVAAARERQSALAGQHGAATEADRVLAETLASAHAAVRESIRRLDSIAEQIDRAVLHQADLSIDTPMGAREFHKFLLTKQREITAVMADAREFDHSKRVVLENLRAQYTPDAG
jgi:vacuolar-type H+-ATPase subunit H